MTKINSCSYLDPYSKKYLDTNEKFKKLSCDKKFLVVLAAFFAGVASFFMGGLGGLAAYRQLVQKFSTSPTAKKTDELANPIIKQEELDKAIEKESEELANLPAPPVGFEWVKNFIDVRKFFQQNPSDEIIQQLAKSTDWLDSKSRLSISTLGENCPEDKISVIAIAIANSPKHLRALLKQLKDNFRDSIGFFDNGSIQKRKKAILSVFEVLTEKQKMSFITIDPEYNSKEKSDAEDILELIAPLLIALKKELKLTSEFLAEAEKLKFNGVEEEIEKERINYANIPTLPGYESITNLFEIYAFFETNPSDELIQKLAKSSIWEHSFSRLCISLLADYSPVDKLSLITASVADSPKHIKELLFHFCLRYVFSSPKPRGDDSPEFFQKYKAAIITIFEAMNEKQKMAFITMEPDTTIKRMKDIAPVLIELKEELKLTPEFLTEAQKFATKE